MHWSEPYIGMPYVPGDNDCASFAARVVREVFAREIGLPHERSDGVSGWSRQIECAKNDYGIRVNKPEEGDAVLMIGRGRLNHIGVYCVIGGVGYVLHAMLKHGAVALHRIRDLDNVGLAVEGYYRWK